jgi:hypothetical protein
MRLLRALGADRLRRALRQPQRDTAGGSAPHLRYRERGVRLQSVQRSVLLLGADRSEEGREAAAENACVQISALSATGWRRRMVLETLATLHVGAVGRF